MTEAERRFSRQRLLALKQRHGGILSALEEEALRPGGAEADRSLSEVPFHPADLASGEYEEEVTLGLLENEAQLLGEVDAALGRLEQGSFGRCEECGQEISRTRLHTMPYARYCLQCARKLLGKSGS